MIRMESTIIQTGECIEYKQEGKRLFPLILKASLSDEIDVLLMDEIGNVDALERTHLMKIHGMKKLRLSSGGLSVRMLYQGM